MSIDSAFIDKKDKTIKNLSNFINNKLKVYGNEISKNIAKNFVRIAKRTLRERSQATKETKYLVNRVARNISFIEKTNKNGLNKYYVKVTPDEEGLYMFLEYGTGLIGESNSHNQPWEYAINREDYVEIKDREGFIFTNKGNNYIDNNDEQIIRKYSGKKKYTSKKTGQIKIYGPYKLKTPIITKGVFSQGIKPISYIYDTKILIKGLLKSYKGKKNFRGLRTKLNNLKPEIK